MKKGIAVLAVTLLVVLYACKHETVNPQNTGNTGNGGNGGNDNDIVCFEADILPIFQTSCAKSGCHNASSAQKGYVLDSYNNIVKKGIKKGNANNSDIYKALIDSDPNDRMPQPPYPALLPQQIALIKKWIDQGANNTTNCGTACDATQFAYTANIKPIIDKSCINCHSGTAASAGLNFSTHAGLQAVALNGRLYGAITHAANYKAMPQGGNKLSDCNISQIQKWIQAGAPNN